MPTQGSPLSFKIGIGKAKHKSRTMHLFWLNDNILLKTAKKLEENKDLKALSFVSRRLRSLIAPLLYRKASLPNLPAELLEFVVQNLSREKDINALCRVNRSLYHTLNPLLYQHNVEFSKSSALYWAAGNDQRRTLRLCLLYENDSEIKDRALRYSARFGHREIVNILISSGANIDASYSENSDRTPLLSAMPTPFNGNLRIDRTYPHCYVTNRDLNEIVAYTLVACGANVLSTGSDGNTILHRACYYGLDWIVAQCIDRGADVNAANQRGQTPLHCAVRGWGLQKCSFKIMRLLLGNGADAEILDKQRRTPVHFWTNLNRPLTSQLACSGYANSSAWLDLDNFAITYDLPRRSVRKTRALLIDREIAIVREERKISALVAFAVAEAEAKRQRRFRPQWQHYAEEMRYQFDIILSQKRNDRQVLLAELTEAAKQREIENKTRGFFKSSLICWVPKNNDMTEIQSSKDKTNKGETKVASLYQYLTSQVRWTDTRSLTAQISSSRSEMPENEHSRHHASLAPLRVKTKFRCRCCGPSKKTKGAVKCLDCDVNLCAYCVRLALPVVDELEHPELGELPGFLSQILPSDLLEQDQD